MRFEFERESSLHLSMSNRRAIICCEVLNFSERGFNGKRPVAPPTRRTVPAVSVKRSGTRSSRRLFGHCFELARESGLETRASFRRINGISKPSRPRKMQYGFCAGRIAKIKPSCLARTLESMSASLNCGQRKIASC